VVIKVENISFAIDGKLILDNVSMEADSGMLGLIGPNGAGKTTLLRVISAYIKPDRGRVLINGEDIKGIDIKTRARLMALVPQNYALDYDFTVLETVLMGRNPHKKDFEPDNAEDYDLARKCIKKAGIAGLEDRSILGLSGGEWQRMVIARALCQESKIMLMDEPVSSLDIKHQTGIMDTVKILARDNGLACVCVLHDLNLAYNYCDRIALMKDGKIVDAGYPDEVMEKKKLEDVYDTRIRIIEAGERKYIFPEMSKYW